MGRKFDWHDSMRLRNVQRARELRLSFGNTKGKEYIFLICNLCSCQHYRYRYMSERKKTPIEIKRGEF